MMPITTRIKLPANQVTSQATAAGIRTWQAHQAGCECRTCRRIRRKLIRKESS